MVSKLVIEGMRKLGGEVSVHGAKNSVLPILAATILVDGKSVIHNCPDLSDVDASMKILRHLGCEVTRDGHSLTVDTTGLTRFDIPDDLMREMRSSIVFLGAIVARFGKARMSLPGGCELGPRPIDLHLKALRQLGVEIEEHHGYLNCTVPRRLEGANVAFSFPSVGATENLMLAASLSQGITTITNPAREPEIIDLANFLNTCGAHVFGAGDGNIVVEGVKALHSVEHAVIPDRIAATTFMAAAAITGGDILLSHIDAGHLSGIIPMFEESGCNISVDGDRMHLIAPPRLSPIKVVRTMPYPGFPTDAQAPLMAMTTTAQGTSVFVENIFESRYKHACELSRLGANIKVEGRVAVVEGVERLWGACVQSPDLRGAAALVIAGLAAEGITEVTGLRHLDRGYERIEAALTGLGAAIKRI